MNKMKVFTYKRINNADLALLRSVASAFNLSVTSCNVDMFDLESGEIIANIGGLATKCKGLSVWATRKDIGVRLHEDYISKHLNNEAVKAIINSNYKHLQHKTERRYSFSNMRDVVFFISSLSAYSNKETKAIKESETIAV